MCVLLVSYTAIRHATLMQKRLLGSSTGRRGPSPWWTAATSSTALRLFRLSGFLIWIDTNTPAYFLRRARVCVALVPDHYRRESGLPGWCSHRVRGGDGGDGRLGQNQRGIRGQRFHSLPGHQVRRTVTDAVLLPLRFWRIAVVCHVKHVCCCSRINHAVILDDPFDDPPDLPVPDRSPEPTKEQLDVSVLTSWIDFSNKWLLLGQM